MKTVLDAVNETLTKTGGRLDATLGGLGGRSADAAGAAEGGAAHPAAERLAAVTVPPARNARVFGSLDAVATGVRRDLGDAAAKQWQRDVFRAATRQASAPPPYDRDPAGHLVDTWWRTLRTGGLQNSSDTFGQQGADMVDDWRVTFPEEPRARSLTYVTPGVFSPARLASPPPHMADCPSCSVEC
ncbi:hypothetical protein [Streptomyces sp. NPDC053069]|uniref:hypothetical protein n=1 Tax=Streptomyces sp. NPDC053069 TaxID=3365695 RepID=UPI0037D5EF5B